MSTLIFCCGAECGIVAAGAAMSKPEHWNDVNDPVTINTTDQRSGDNCYEFDVTAAAAYLEHDLPADNRNVVVRVALRFEAFPSADNVKVVFFYCASSADDPNITIDSAGNLYAGLGSTLSDPKAIDLDTWYIVDIYADTSSDTFTVDWQVDGIAQDQVSKALATPDDIARLSFGPRTSPRP